MADYSRLSDDELLRRTRDDPDAFGAFYERHARALLHFLTGATRDVELALDLTAEVFAAALVASGRYRPGEAPARAWLLGIARNKLASARRHAGTDAAARRKLGMPVLDFSDEAIERVEEAIDAAAGEYLEGMAALSVAEREAVTARVIEERDYPEIAAATGATEAAVRQRVSRGLSKLARRRAGGGA